MSMRLDTPSSRISKFAIALGLVTALAVMGASGTTAFADPPPNTDSGVTDNRPDCPGAGGGGGCGHCRRAGTAGHPERGGRGGGPPEEMRAAHFLIEHRDQIERSVEEIPGGVMTRTTTQDAEVLAELRTHVGEMESLLEQGGRIRNWDPLFAEIFDNREAIEMEIDAIDHGVLVRETSTDPQVAELIRAHARKVDEFLARGHAACREATPLPEDPDETSP